MMNARVKPNETEHSILYGEAGGACPLCTLPIIIKKTTSKRPIKGYEVAHIYPLNPNAAQATALAGYEVPAEINALENLIALCPSCHSRYDKDFKIEEYLNLLQIKKTYISEANARNTVPQHALQDEVNEILDIITKNDSDNDIKDLSAKKLDVFSLDEKLKTGVSPLQKREIRINAIDFFVRIRNHIRLIEQRDQVAIKILQQQVNTYYLIMNKQNPDNKDIVFNHISKWISLKTGKSIIASKVLVSFFVQNCEVFDADPN